MRTWMVGRGSMKRHCLCSLVQCQTRNNYTAIWKQETSQILTTNTQIGSGNILKNNVIIMVYTCRVTHYYQQRQLFERFHNKCIGIYELDPSYFLSAPRFAWQACLKETEVGFELLIDIDILLMEKKYQRWNVSEIHRNAKANDKCMIDYDIDENACGWFQLQK